MSQPPPARPRREWPVFSLDPLAAWAAALGAFLVVLALQLEVDMAGRPYPFLMFPSVILLSTWISGRAPALAVALASALASWWFLMRTPGTLGWPTPAQAAALALFLAAGVLAIVVVGGLADATRRARQAAGAAAAALAAQRLLSAELQHRVANNLQGLAAALTQQARRQESGPAAAALVDATRRLDVVGRLHRLLATIEAEADAAQVLPELCRLQVEAGGGHAALAIDITAGLLLGPDRLMLLGMIVSEALSNATKHAIPDSGAAQISVRLHGIDDGRLELEVRDSGPGLPAGFDLRTTASLGLRIVESLARRLDGCLSLNTDHGTVLRLRFPLAEPKAQA